MANRDHSLDDGIIQAAYSEFLAYGFQKASLHKIAQRLGNFDAYGPILLGLNAPINDLSRGCNAQEVYSMAIITAALA